MPNTIDDIVKRLRQRDEYDAVLDHMNQLYGLAKSLEHEAADEIERLRAERDRLREGLQGRSWNEINGYWIDGLNRARAATQGDGT
jgi:hypothetical protein